MLAFAILAGCGPGQVQGGQPDAGRDADAMALPGLHVEAGEDAQLILPVDAITLTAHATDTEGTVTTTSWTQVDGPAPATLAGADGATLALAGLTVGTYHFQVSVGDDHGATATDRVAVTVATPGGTVYYVDATAGSDAADGTSLATPWRSLARVHAASLGPGDVVSLARGEIWRESLVVPASGDAMHVLGFTSHGDGAAPIISGSDLVSGAWSSSGGNVWTHPVAIEPLTVYFDGQRGQRTGALTAARDFAWSSGVLSVYSPTEPGATYATIEAAARDRVVDTAGQAWVELDDLDVRDGNELIPGRGQLRLGPGTAAHLVVRRCRVTRGRGSGIEIDAASQLADLTITDSTISDNGSIGVLFASVSSGPSRITRCVLHGNGWTSREESSQRSNIQGALGQVEISYNDIADAVPGIANDPTQSHGIYVSTPGGTVDIHHNVIHDNSNGAGIKARFDATIHDNLIYGNRLSAVEAGGNGANPARYELHGNVFYGSTTGFPSLSEDVRGTGTITMLVTNNTAYQDGSAFASTHVISIADDLGGDLTFENNVVFASAGHVCLGVAAQSGSVTIDYNLYWAADGGDPGNSYGGTASTTLAAWQARGYDLHGLHADPELAAPPADMTLLPGSPAIDSGTDLGRPFSGTAPDLGCCERP
jgi:hypothetical protein